MRRSIPALCAAAVLASCVPPSRPEVEGWMEEVASRTSRRAPPRRPGAE